MMEIKEYISVDRTGWASGPWDTEPDKRQWPDPGTGLPCLAVRNPAGHWCGYVGVDQRHPLFGKHYNQVQDFDVHGGLTFADMCRPRGDEASDICHVPGPGEPDHVWWFGFDCAHALDRSPRRWYPEDEGLAEYRTLDYVVEQCALLAKRLQMW